MKRIALLTSGGDAPGMNACIRAAVRAALSKGMEVVGIRRGYFGLVNDDVIEMDDRSVSGIIQRGGTMLFTARCPEFNTEEGLQKGYDTLKRRGIEGLIVIGGDGSFRGARDLTERFGFPTVGIPGTIDNDLPYTDFTLGFDTAVNTVVSLVNNVRDTMTSHERVSVIEVMGRNCGDIALYSGLASGAEIIVIPEAPMTLTEIERRVKASRSSGKSSIIIIVAEGVHGFNDIVKDLEEELGLSVRTTIIGHIQRGGAPSMADRVLACKFAHHAVALLAGGKGGRVVGVSGGSIVDFGITEALKTERPMDMYMYKLAGILAR